MSWLRNSSLTSSFIKQRSRDSPPKDADPVACYDSFREHWQQSHDIICHSLPPKGIPSQDDVLGVVNHVEQMIMLLLLELRDFSLQQRHQSQRLQQRNMILAAQFNAHCSPCLEHLLSENLLDKLYEWSTHTGRFGDAVRLKQLKLYVLLISHDSSLLAHEPVTRPLLHLLDKCAGDIMLPEVQNELVVLLNHVCVSLVQNNELLGLFFRPTATGRNRFIISTLLTPYIHQEGGVGQQARDAMLLCMSLSKKNDEIGNYIAEESHICSVLATGLSGLYCLLPTRLDIESDDWHRLTVDDINDLRTLTQLMNSLEFCNAVTQVVHPLVQKQLLEYLYRGFLVPVIGPALLQTSVDELIAATAYFDLFLRTVTEPGLLKSLIRFLLEENYDDNRMLDHLIRRISSQRSRLSMVTLALFETLVDLNCEDVMLELCLRALAPCSHVMLSQRRRLLRDLDPFERCAEKFLSLTPNCCAIVSPSIYIAAAAIASVSPSTSPNLIRQVSNASASTVAEQAKKQRKSASKNNKLSAAATSESLYNNYYAYLRDARQKIAACQLACTSWSRRYEEEEEDIDDSDNENGNYEEYYDDCDSSVSVSVHNSQDKDYDVDFCKRIGSKDAALSTSQDLISRNNSMDDNVNKNQSSISENLKSMPENEFDPDLNEVMIHLTTSEREKLYADIAELLGETLDEQKSPAMPEISVSKTLGGNANESNTILNSLQLSLSGGESSGYESFAFKGSNESTPVNEDYDDEGCRESKRSPERISNPVPAQKCEVPNELHRNNNHTRKQQQEQQQQQQQPQKLKQQEQQEQQSLQTQKQKQQPQQQQHHQKAVQTSIYDNRRMQMQQRRRRLQRRSAVTKNAGSNRQQDIVDGQPPSVGIFLDVILKKLECMTDNNVFVNLHLTGLISRLAIYPQPLLQSFLLNHSLLFQPSIRSLFQVLASLKQKIDGFISKQDDVSILVEQARVFLISRENRLVNARKNILEAAAQVPNSQKHSMGGDLVCKNASMSSMPTIRAMEPKRRSLTSSLTQIFRKSSTSLESQIVITDSFNSNDSHSSYIAEAETKNGNIKNNTRHYDQGSWERPKKFDQVQNIILCAVILDEWLKELAAITQEHTIISWFSTSTASDNSKLQS